MRNLLILFSFLIPALSFGQGKKYDLSDRARPKVQGNYDVIPNPTNRKLTILPYVGGGDPMPIQVDTIDVKNLGKKLAIQDKQIGTRVAFYTLAAIRAWNQTAANSPDAITLTDIRRQRVFYKDASDNTTADNGGTVIVTASGVRFKHNPDRVFDAALFGALGNNVNNDQPFIQATYDATPSGKECQIPEGSFRVNSTLSFTKGVNISGLDPARTTLVFSNTATWGMDLNGAGFGGSPTDAVTIKNLNLAGEAKALIHAYGTGLFRIERIIAQNTSSCVFYFDQCQDFGIKDVDVFAAGNASSGKTGAVCYIKDCNNLYSNIFRVEAPKTYAIYSENSYDISFLHGKVDGNVLAGTINPYLVCDGGEVRCTDMHFEGAIAPVAKLIGASSFKFINCAFRNSTCDYLIDARQISYKKLLTSDGYLPGVIQSPSVTFGGTTEIVAQANNATGQVIGSLISAVAPPQSYTAHGTDYKTASGFYRGDALGDSYVALTYNNGSSYVPVSGNDEFTGLYVTHKQTGAHYRAWTNIGTDTYLDSKTVPADGAFYQIEYSDVSGLRVNADRLNIDYRTKKSFNVFQSIVPALAVTASTWDATNKRTNVSFSTTGITANSLTGYYLTASTGANYLITGNSTSQVYLAYDQSTAVTAATYSVQAGHYTSTPFIISYGN